MEKAFYKIETSKVDGKWWAILYKRVMVKQIETWEIEKQVFADSHQELMFKQGDEAFITKVNENDI